MKKLCKIIEQILHIPNLIILLVIWIVFTLLAIKTLIFAIYWIIISPDDTKEFLSEIFLVFLFAEIVASIKIYFAQNFHFPLRFFVYIWITDLIRYLIINHENPSLILPISWWILILIIWLAIIEFKNAKLEKTKNKKGEDLNI